MPDADLSLAVPAVFFGSVGTAGQRCTSTRRLYLHSTIAPEFLARLQNLYASLKPGDPLDPGTLLGPLHTHAALDIYHNAIAELRAADADILIGAGRYDGNDKLPSPLDHGNFVRPTIAVPPPTTTTTTTTTATGAASLWATERFAPILYVAEFDELEQAIAWNNAVRQGLSSSLWTRDMRNVGKWIGPTGSDAGIVNVSMGLQSSLSFFFFCGGEQKQIKKKKYFPVFLAGQRWHERRRDWRCVWREQG
jgi:aldehyde dehydrogenase family 7 member A1